jgi:predicted amidohydrolase
MMPQSVEFIDPYGQKSVGTHLLVPQMTIRASEIVFREMHFL